jgi:simple sugar transport system ATP-binding protein
MVHQHFQLIDTFTVVENIVVGTESLDMILKLGEARKRIQALCDQYELDINLDAEIWQLCVGHQQWVEILKALYLGIDLLILDEPTSVLTPQETEKLFDVLKAMKEDGLSIVLITHKLHEVMEVSDRVTVLRKGKKVATVKTSETNQRELAMMMVGREVLFRVTKEEGPAGEIMLIVKDLWAHNDRKQYVVKGVSFTLRGCEILGLAGVAGNGQKELFETLIGVRKAAKGEVILDGENMANHSTEEIMRKGIGHIPEDRTRVGLISGFRVSENLFLGYQRSRPFRKGLF